MHKLKFKHHYKINTLFHKPLSLLGVELIEEGRNFNEDKPAGLLGFPF